MWYICLFLRFPKDENQSAKWIKAIGRDQWKPSIHSLVCSKHFLEEMIHRTSLSCVRLREHAVPTIFETCSSEPKNVR